MFVNAVTNQTVYWYGYPPWSMLNPDQVQSFAPLRKKTALTAVEQVHKVTPLAKAHPYLGRNINRYV